MSYGKQLWLSLLEGGLRVAWTTWLELAPSSEIEMKIRMQEWIVYFVPRTTLTFQRFSSTLLYYMATESLFITKLLSLSFIAFQFCATSSSTVMDQSQVTIQKLHNLQMYNILWYLIWYQHFMQDIKVIIFQLCATFGFKCNIFKTHYTSAFRSSPMAEDQDIEKILKARALTEGQEREDPDWHGGSLEPPNQRHVGWSKINLHGRTRPKEDAKSRREAERSALRRDLHSGVKVWYRVLVCHPLPTYLII